MLANLPDPFAAHVVTDGAAAAIQLHGELDLAAEEDVASAFAQVLDARPTAVTVDLRNLVFLDSTGLCALLRLRESCSTLGCELRLVRGGPSIQRVLEVSGVAAHFAIVDAGDAAFAAA